MLAAGEGGDAYVSKAAALLCDSCRGLVTLTERVFGDSVPGRYRRIAEELRSNAAGEFSAFDRSVRFGDLNTGALPDWPRVEDARSTPESVIRALFNDRRCLLLDFDGPVCSVFAGFRNYEVADQLRRSLDLPFPFHIATTEDPFVVFRFATQFGDSVARKAEYMLAHLEVQAVRRAKPTSAADDVIRAFTDRSGIVGMVSNNTGAAVDRYFTDRGLRDRIAGIYSRGVHRPTAHHLSRLKPDPFLLKLAMERLGVSPADCVYIGDSVTDIQAAHRAGMPAIALADKPGKAARFEPYLPEVTISDMRSVLHAI